MTIFSQSVFDATVIYQGNELFKGQGAANGWAAKVAAEVGAPVTVEKYGTGWIRRRRTASLVHHRPADRAFNGINRL
jgi:hypothetical protein